MDKLKLYNWYGEEFDLIVPENGETLKAYKHQVNNLFDRLIDNVKNREKIDKDLFLRAKAKINDNLKRELNSHKIAYQNKIKVLKDSISNLNFAKSMTKMLKKELSKLRKSKNQLLKYAKDFEYSLTKTTDELETKKDKIKNLINKTALDEHELFKKYAIFSIILIYIQKNEDREFKIDKIKQYLVDAEVNFISKLNNPNQFFKDIYLQLEQKRSYFLENQSLLKEKYLKSYKLQKQLYENEKYNIKLSAKQKILELEFDYNEKFTSSRKKVYEYRDAAKEKIAKHKQEILNVESKNISYLKQLKSSGKVNIKNLKIAYKNNLKNISVKAIEHIQNNFAEFLNNKFEDKNYASLFLENKNLDLVRKSASSEDLILINIAYKYYFSKTNLYAVKKEYKNLFKAKFLEKQSAVLSKYTYEGKFKKEVSVALNEYVIDSDSTRLKFLNEKIEAVYELEKLKITNSFEAEKENYKNKKQILKKEYKNQLKELIVKKKNKEISEQAVKNKKTEYKILYKEALYSLKLESNVSKNKEILKTSFWRKLAENKVNRKIKESKINEAQKTIPTECIKTIKFWAFILGFILPGLPEIIFFKQYLKGTILLIASTLIYSLIIPFTFGAYWDKMGGIPGLSDLGASVHHLTKNNYNFADARYYLFGGVISVILFVMSFVYLLVSAISAYRVAKYMQQGSRPSLWSHTKYWLNTSGFPWMISLVGWILMIFIVATPVITSVLISFTNYGFNHEAPTKIVEWVGLKQWGSWWTYRKLDLITSISHVITWTLIWTVFSTLIPIGLGIIIAILNNNSRIKGKKIFRLIFILPWAIPAFVTLTFLRNSFQAGDTSYINLILLKLGIISKSVDWLNKITTARILVILVQTWIGYAWIFMLVTGNLQSISKDIYEAGSVDGGKNRQLFWYLTLPSLLASIAPMLIGQFVGAFNNFTTISLFTGGGPLYENSTFFKEGATDIIISWVYKFTTGAIQLDGNQAFAAALVTLASLFSIALAARGFIKSMSRRD